MIVQTTIPNGGAGGSASAASCSTRLSRARSNNSKRCQALWQRYYAAHSTDQDPWSDFKAANPMCGDDSQFTSNWTSLHPECGGGTGGVPGVPNGVLPPAPVPLPVVPGGPIQVGPPVAVPNPPTPVTPGAGVPLVRGGSGTAALAEYQPGTYPVPAWAYGTPAPSCSASPCGCGGKKKKRGMRKGLAGLLFGLGDDFTDPNPSIFVGSGGPPIDPVTGMPTNPNSPQVSVYSVAPGGGSLTSSQLVQIATTPNVALPSVNPSTLLAAAALPGAPAAVTQAAAAYSAANPFSSFLSGSVGGISTLALLGGGLLLVVLMAGGSSRRR